MDTTEAKATAQDAAGDTGDWIDRFARAGLVARGSVYVLFGFLTIKVSLGQRPNAPNTRGALAEVTRQSFGRVVIWLVALGLVCWTATLALGALRGRGGRKPGSNDLTDRLSNASSAVINASLTVAAFSLAIDAGHAPSSQGNDKEQGLTARVLGLPGGRLLVGAVGLGFVGYAVFKAKKAFEQTFAEGLQLARLDQKKKELVLKLGVAGHLARAVVFLLIGVFVVRAAVRFDANEAVGLDGALSRLARASYGPPLLFAVAAGLLAFGLWGLLAARYRRPDG